jgi:superfamily II DNA or RNA helicase/HKD family nuclease
VELRPGLYEALVTNELASLLGAIPDELAEQRQLASAEAADRIALYLSREIKRALAGVGDDDRVAVSLRVAQRLFDELGLIASVDPAARLTDTGNVLRAVFSRRPDGLPMTVAGPLTPLLDTTLLTNARVEPNLWSQLNSEIESAERIDVVMAFIRRSGIRPLMEALQRHCASAKRLRVLTTTYTGSTERAALEMLRDAGAEVRVSYDVGSTRLHAKAWLFHRAGEYSTAYVGSSNLTHSAQVTGLEWNVRVSAARNQLVVQQVTAVFDTYWNNGDFVPFDPAVFDDEQRRVGGSASGPTVILSPIELQPRPFQQRLLELIEVSRQAGHHRNLLVAATGTGKTVMAALDYGSLCQTMPRARLLFVAHREEILDQSMATFRYALRDPSFGEKWVGKHRPERFDHAFASIQSLTARSAATLPPDHFDVVIIDEFHHAAAASYTALLERLRPAELLGLTATPERSDGLPVLHWFGDRIAAELRLWDAIDEQYLAPFLYYGIFDGVDLTEIPWRRGQGYEVDALTSVYTSSDAWARQVIDQVRQHTDPKTMRGLGFCVSIQHAQFMADRFRRHGIDAVAIWGETPTDDRRRALRDLDVGNVKIVFSVDLFNEGVDVPAVDTVLMLRPTESPTLFLQQLGRGLRKAPDKACCVVLDFVGQHRREFRFDRRYRALLGGGRRDVERQVEQQFPYLPAGCSMQLDRKATEVVMRSIREAIPSRWASKVDELKSLRREQPDITLRGYLDESGLELEDIYHGNKSWSDLLAAAGRQLQPSGPNEDALRRALGRNLHVDDRERLDAYRGFMTLDAPPSVAAMSDLDRRLLRMLATALADQVLTRDMTFQDAVDLLWQHPQVRVEFAELCDVLVDGIDHVHTSIVARPELPLRVHARYTRLEILSAFGLGSGARTPQWREGVYYASEAAADLLAFTLDKSSGNFSPTTRYQDYAISPTLIHWESQSTTRADSPTGLRYREHERLGHSIFLFTRLRTDERAFWFLGPASYRGHEGERPMAVTWELDTPLSGDMFTMFAAAVA